MLIDINKELYIPTIHSLWLDVEEDGRVYQKRGEEKTYIALKNKQLVLPLPEIVKQIKPDQVCFHPLSENIARGDSNMISMIKKLITVNANRITILMIERLMRIALKAIEEPDAIHLKGKQLELLTILPDVNKNTAAHLSAALGEIDLVEHQIIKFYNRRSGKIGDRQYMRLAVTSFPLFDQIKDPTKSAIWGKKTFRKRDYKDYQALFDYIVPKWDTPNHYSVGSDNTEAPTFVSLMTAYLKYMTRMNELIDTFSEHLTVEKEFYTDMTVEPAITNVVRYRGLIPPLEGNIGAVSGKEEPVTQTQGVTANLDNFAVTDVPNVSENINTQPQDGFVSWNGNNQNNGWNGNQNSGWGDGGNGNNQGTWNSNPNPQNGQTWTDWLNNRNGNTVVGNGADPVGEWLQNTGQNQFSGGWNTQQNNQPMGWGSGNPNSGYQGPPVISGVGCNTQSGWGNNQGGWGNGNNGWGNGNNGGWGDSNQNSGWGNNNQNSQNGQQGVVNPFGFKTR